MLDAVLDGGVLDGKRLAVMGPVRVLRYAKTPKMEMTCEYNSFGDTVDLDVIEYVLAGKTQNGTLVYRPA